MVLARPGTALQWTALADREPGPGEIRVQVGACGVCRTDLHVVDGELPQARLPVIPGHEIVGRVDRLGAGVSQLQIGDRVGIPWLGHTCGVCPYCLGGRENLCDDPQFTGCTRDGGYATAAIADARFAFALTGPQDDVALAPLLCAGLIGWRALRHAAHIVAQVAAFQGRSVYAFTRTGDLAAQSLARGLGAVWAGNSEDLPPQELDAAILFAAVGALVPQALQAVRKGGRVVCAGIHMSDIPAFPYDLLWGERHVLSVANLTREDGVEFLGQTAHMGIVTHTTTYPLKQANAALEDLRAGRLVGAAVLLP
jgi:propanol-preferring alcohol dehydrogenase